MLILASRSASASSSAFNASSFNHFVGNGKHARRNHKPKRFGGLQIDKQLVFGRH